MCVRCAVCYAHGIVVMSDLFAWLFDGISRLCRARSGLSLFHTTLYIIYKIYINLFLFIFFSFLPRGFPHLIDRMKNDHRGRNTHSSFHPLCFQHTTHIIFHLFFIMWGIHFCYLSPRELFLSFFLSFAPFHLPNNRLPLPLNFDFPIAFPLSLTLSVRLNYQP